MAVLDVKRFFNFKCQLTDLGKGLSDPLLFSLGQEFSDELEKRSNKELVQLVGIIKKTTASNPAQTHLFPVSAIVAACEKCLAEGWGPEGLALPECYATSGLLILGVAEDLKDEISENLNAESTHTYRGLLEHLMWNYRLFKLAKTMNMTAKTIGNILPPMLQGPLFEMSELGGKSKLREKAMTAVEAKKVKLGLLKDEVLARYAEQRIIGRLKFGKWNSPLEASKYLYHTMVEPTKRVKKRDGQEDTRWRTTYEWLLEFEKTRKSSS